MSCWLFSNAASTVAFVKLPQREPSSKESSDASSAVHPVSGSTRPLVLCGESGEPGATLGRLRPAGLAERTLALACAKTGRPVGLPTRPAAAARRAGAVRAEPPALSGLSAMNRNTLRKDPDELCGSTASDRVRPAGRAVALLPQETRGLVTVEAPPLAPPPPTGPPRKTVRSAGVAVPLVCGEVPAPKPERPPTGGEATHFDPTDCQEDSNGSGRQNDGRLPGVRGVGET